MSSPNTPNGSGANAVLVRPWRQALPAVLLLLAFILFLYRDTAMGMVEIWSRSDTFAHGFLILPIVCWLVWRRRDALAAQTPRPSFAFIFLIAVVGFIWLLADLVAINAVTQLALVTLLVLAVPGVLGWQVARLIAFPLGFLFFAVPIGEFMMPKLMGWTADFTVLALRLSGVPVYRDGLQFVIPSGNWSVVEACSGVRYLIASLTVGTLFAYLNYQSTLRRVMFVLVAIAVPIVANWLRAYMIVMLGHYSGNTLAVGVDHLIYGWAFFGVVIMLMFIIGARWSEPDQPVGGNSNASKIPSQAFVARRLTLAMLCLAVVVALPRVVSWSLERSEGADEPLLAAPAQLSPKWHLEAENSIKFKPTFENPSAELNAVYTDQAQPVGVYLGYYRNQDYQRKLVTSTNVLVRSNDRDWAQVGQGGQVVALDGKSVAVKTAKLRSGGLANGIQAHNLLVWQVYWINGTLTSSDHLAKLYNAFYRLIGRGDDSAVIILYAKQDPDVGAEKTLETFLADNFSAIDALLVQAKIKQ